MDPAPFPAGLEPLPRGLTPMLAGPGPSPFLNGPEDRNAVYVAPKLWCRVAYSEWTQQRMLRAPSYKGLVS